ncbi:MAG: hypothetical protein HFH45_01335 [Bacilli bacterium]|jgi:hypothetical protein|nr:hypothetical protein [Bacilli bacterium]
MRWNKTIYIASKLGEVEDDYGNMVITYDKPIKYEFNVQPTLSEVELMEFGEKASMIQKAIIPIRYKGIFHENDVAYLDDVTPEGEIKNGANANYRLYPPRNQNRAIAIYFERLIGK